MKIQCDVCNKDEASVFCSADEAALCNGCDHRVHHANKLASKHHRFSLLHPSSSSSEAPRCDICQERRAFLFCREDRAILCRECDVSIHTANELTKKHNRFLLTGVKLSSTSAIFTSGSTTTIISSSTSNTERDIWLDSKESESVVYVNFGSVAVMTTQQLVEFAWGLANTKHTFLWIIRPDLVVGESAMLPPEFIEETKERGVLASWCPQEHVLNHPSIAGFLTHCGWNSIIESLSSGVPMICCPFFADQQTNCCYTCKHWGVGMEIDNEVKRDEVERLVRELMEGETGKKMKNKAMGWKKKAEEATSPGGSSSANIDEIINKFLIVTKKSSSLK